MWRAVEKSVDQTVEVMVCLCKVKPTAIEGIEMLGVQECQSRLIHYEQSSA